MNDEAQRLLARIEGGDARVAVLGLGYVGLPLALAFSERGTEVLGFDVDAAKVEALSRGESYIRHLPAERVRAARDSGLLEGTTDFDRLDEPDVVILCVPTPLSDGREPDLTYVTQTARQVRRKLRRGQLVILESTTYPGTTEGLLRRELEESGLAAGDDFFLAYSPEREDPGNPDFGTRSIPKVVGGLDAASLALAQAVYRRIIGETVPVRDTRTAEATKLTENIFRAVNIALANELKMVFDRMDVDVWEVLDAADTKPFGFMKFTPGPGWGGHCIPIDPFYLSWKARELGIDPRFIDLAGQINVEMPAYVIGKLEAGLAGQGKELAGARIMVLGLAYKKDVADPRESPAFEILARLHARGCTLSYHDPLIPAAPTMRTWSDLPPLSSTALTPEVLREQDAVVLVTDHSDVDYDLVESVAPLIVDTRGVFRPPGDKVIPA